MTKIEELEQELFEMERKLKSMFNSCSQDLAIGIEKLRGELAELKESKKEGKWKPKYNDHYWFKSTDEVIGWLKWEDNKIDNWRYNNIPIFPTKEECERYWYFMDTVKEKSYEFSREDFSDDNIPKFYIESCYGDKEIYVTNTWHYKKLGMIYFKDEESAQYIIDNFKDELMEFVL